MYFQEQRRLLGKAPRLVDAATRFKRTSKAILDNLSAIEKKGYVKMPDGKVDKLEIIQEIPALYDIFISYSHVDKESVEPIIETLEEKGFYVWIDEREMQVGDDIVQKINHGLERSKLFAIVLSKNSVNSPWVKQELSYIVPRNIGEKKSIIRPILLDGCKLPPLLASCLYADFSKNWNEGMQDLLRSLDVPVAQVSVKDALDSENVNFSGRIISYRKEIDDVCPKDITTQAFKEWVIFPKKSVHIDKRNIKSLLDKVRVRFQRYGGIPLPSELYGDAEECGIPKNNGFAYIHPRRKIGRVEAFYYWRMDTNGVFIARYSLREDELRVETESSEYENILSYEWLVKDVVAPLILAKNLLSVMPQMGIVDIEFTLSGMNRRKLTLLNRHRVGFSREYKTNEREIKIVFQVTEKSDLQNIAIEGILDIVWLFGWEQVSRTTLVADVDCLLGGYFPQ